MFISLLHWHWLLQSNISLLRGYHHQMQCPALISSPVIGVSEIGRRMTSRVGRPFGSLLILLNDCELLQCAGWCQRYLHGSDFHPEIQRTDSFIEYFKLELFMIAVLVLVMWCSSKVLEENSIMKVQLP